MKTELSRVIVALAVVIALVGAVGVVSADMTTDATDAPVHSGNGLVGHMADGITEMAHMGEHMNGPMTEHMNDHVRGEHHTGNHHTENHAGNHHGEHHSENHAGNHHGEHYAGNHHGSGHGHC